MIKELIQFTKSIDDLKNVGVQPKQGLYIQLTIQNDDGQLSLKVKHAETFGKKTEMNPFLKHCAAVVQNTWMISPNKCLDSSAKGIHSCSPYCVAFKRDSLPTLTLETIQRKVETFKNELPEKTAADVAAKKVKDYEASLKNTGAKFNDNQKEKKLQVYERINPYFEKAFLMLDTEGSEKGRIEVFRNGLNSKEGMLNLLNAVSDYEDLSDAEYIVFFLDVPMESILKANAKYQQERLFNTDKYNTPPDTEGEIFGTSDFFNTFGAKKTFLMHQTAAFDISGRISANDARQLHEFGQVIGRKILPNPLPIFVYKDEAQLVLPIFKTNALEEPEKRLGYQEILKKIIEAKKLNAGKDKGENAVGNYYLLFYNFGEIKDFDFVSQFEYELQNTEGGKWSIEPLFDDKFSMQVQNVFDFQNVLLPKIFNNALIVHTKAGGLQYKYFDDIDSNYCKTDNTFLLVMKYRQAFYDFIYKSRRQAITQTVFEDIMLTLILDDIRLDEYKQKYHTQSGSIKEKLNILFSLHSNFQPFNKNPLFMANQTIELREFVTQLAKGETTIQNEQQFAFTAGQVIAYLFSKTRSTDRSYSRLEPFLQQTDLAQFQLAVVTLFNRYKHEKYSRRFKTPFSEVTGFAGKMNVREYMPLVLSGFFSNNLLFADKLEEPEVADSEHKE